MPAFALGRLSVNAQGSSVSLQGLQTTGGIQVTALKNIDVNRPIDSGGAMILTSSGKNEVGKDGMGIILYNNVYTHRGDITFAADVRLNPITADLRVPLKDNKQEPPIDCPSGTCKPALCDANSPFVEDGGNNTKLDTVLMVFRFVDRNQRPFTIFKNGKPFVQGFQSTDDLAAADRRVAALRSLIEVRQITVNSNGGNITFAGSLIGKHFRRRTIFPKHMGSNSTIAL
ncbi:MAG: hypothetical protein ACRERU_09530 [Methylococcales bacterium]